MIVEEIPIEFIVPCKEPVRDIDGATINDLRDSILQVGVLVPILVKSKREGKYEIIFGNHRYYAAKVAGLKTIPARIMKVTDREALFLSLKENIQRLELDPYSEGKAYCRLKKELGMSEGDIADEVKKTITRVRERMQLYSNLDKELVPEIGKRLTITNAIHLSKHEKAFQKGIFQKICKSEYIVGDEQTHGARYRNRDELKEIQCICPKCGAKHLKGVSVGR